MNYRFNKQKIDFFNKLFLKKLILESFTDINDVMYVYSRRIFQNTKADFKNLLKICKPYTVKEKQR